MTASGAAGENAGGFLGCIEAIRAQGGVFDLMKLGFIGAGNMGSAIIDGVLRSGVLPAQEIGISRRHPELSADLAARGVFVTDSNEELVQRSDCVVLAIKPVSVHEVVREVFDALHSKLVISIVAGYTHEMLASLLPADARFIRVMPNTPLAVGEGMSVICSRCTCTQEEFDFTRSLFETAGKAAIVEERIYTAANTLSGCGPAFVFEFIEALADGAVRCGVPRKLAYELAAQTLVGSARMVLETGRHPGELKDAVCSPGGTTIEGVYALERGGMRAAVMEAVGASVEKTLRMSRSSADAK